MRKAFASKTTMPILFALSFLWYFLFHNSSNIILHYIGYFLVTLFVLNLFMRFIIDLNQDTD